MFGLTNIVLAVLAAATLGFAAPLDVHDHDCNHTAPNGTLSGRGRGSMAGPLNSTVSPGYANTAPSIKASHFPCENMTSPGNTALHANTPTSGNATFAATNTTNSLSFLDWLFHPLTGTVNFYSRPDCQNPCVETFWCGIADADIRGDLNSVDWSQDQGDSCWDRPAGTKSIGLVVGGHGKGKGYVGITVSCAEAMKGGGEGLETRELSWGKGGFVEKQESNPGGSLPEEVKAVVFVGKGHV